MKPTPEHISKVFGCTVDNARKGLIRSAGSMRNLSSDDLKKWGKTKDEVSRIATEFEARATK